MKTSLHFLRHFERKSNEFVFLQILRGLAATWVCFYHFTTYPIHKEGFPFYEITTSGRLGVFVFLVISGYVIAFSADQRIEQPNDFLINRLARIYPPYLAAFVLVFILAIISIQFSGKTLFQLTNVTPIDYLGNLLLISNLYPHPAYLNGIFWTLCYEIQFYIFVYCCMLLLRKEYRVFFIVIAVLHLVILTIYPDPFYLRYSVFFFIGFLVYLLHRREYTVIALILIVYFGVLSAMRYYQHQSDEYIVGAITAVLILIIKPIDHYFRKMIFFPFVAVGGVSYSLYLIHDTIGSRLIHGISMRFQLTTTNLMWLSISTYVLVLFCATIFYLLFEVRLAGYVKHKCLPRSTYIR